MVPRLFRHGNGNMSLSTSIYLPRVSMEPRPFRHGDRWTSPWYSQGKHGVSMEPRPFKHCDKINKDVAKKYKRISMEPRPFRHGDTSLKKTDKVINGFQWSHVLSDMVTLGFLADTDIKEMRFNGATSFQTWWRIEEYGTENYYWMFQWSHVLSDMVTGSNLRHLQLLENSPFASTSPTSIFPLGCSHPSRTTFAMHMLCEHLDTRI